jgi:hypothetical protein
VQRYGFGVCNSDLEFMITKYSKKKVKQHPLVSSGLLLGGTLGSKDDWFSSALNKLSVLL